MIRFCFYSVEISVFWIGVRKFRNHSFFDYYKALMLVKVSGTLVPVNILLL